MDFKKIFTNKITIGVVCFCTGALVMSAGTGDTVDVAKYENKIKELEEIVAGKDTPVAADGIVTKEEPKKQEKKEALIYEDDKINIYFTQITSKGVEFLMENKTDVQLTVQADSVAINGFSVSDIIMSDPVAPKSKGKIVAKCSTSDFDSTVEKIGGTLRIIDFNGGWESYDANFVDVAVN